MVSSVITETHMQRWAQSEDVDLSRKDAVRARCEIDCATVRERAHAVVTLRDNALPEVTYNAHGALNIIALIGSATLAGMYVPEVVLDEIGFAKALPFGESVPAQKHALPRARRRFQLARMTAEQFAVAGPALWEVLLTSVEARVASRETFQSMRELTLPRQRTIRTGKRNVTYTAYLERIHFLRAHVHMHSPFASLIVANDYLASSFARRRWLASVIKKYGLVYHKRIPEWMPTRTYTRDTIHERRRSGALSLPFTIQPRATLSDSKSLVYAVPSETPTPW